MHKYCKKKKKKKSNVIPDNSISSTEETVSYLSVKISMSSSDASETDKSFWYALHNMIFYS